MRSVSTSASKRARDARLHRAVASIEALERRQLLSVTLTPPLKAVLGSHGDPFAITVADLNGDGIEDLITANGDGTVSVAYGKGNGTFQAPISLSDGLGAGIGGPHDLFASTVNGGTQTFIFVANGQNNQLAVLTTTGNHSLEIAPGFTSTFTIAASGATVNAITYGATSNQPSLVAAGDNGFLTFTQFESGSTFMGFTNAYSPSFAAYGGIKTSLTDVAAGTFTTSTNYGAATTGDEDFVATGANGKVYLFAHGYGLTYSAITTISGANELVSTGDNLIVGYSSSGAVKAAVLVGGPTVSTANFEKVQTINGGKPIFSSGTGEIAIGDFNGDGKPDFAISNGAYALQIFTGNAAGTYTNQFSSTQYGGKGGPLTAGDFNGDGQSSLAIGYGSGTTTASATYARVFLNNTPLTPTITSAGAATVDVGSSGVFYEVTTSAFPVAKITFTGSLPPGLKFTDNGNGTATISGKAATAGKGDFVVNFMATNSGGTASKSVTFQLTQPAKFTGKDFVTFKQGKASLFQISSTGGFTNGAQTPLTTTLNGSTDSATMAVDGLSFIDEGNGIGKLEGVPASSGTESLVVTEGGVTETVTVTVLGRPMFGAITNSFTFDVETANTFTDDLTVPGTPASKVTMSGRLPSGVKFTSDAGTFTIAGTPKKGTQGVYTIEVRASNSQGSATDQPFKFTIDVDEAIVYTSPAAATFTVGQAGKFVIRTLGFPFASFTGGSSTTTSSLPSGLVFTDNKNGTASISGTPATGTGDVYDLVISDSAGDTQNFTLTVKEPPTFATPTLSKQVTANTRITPIVATSSNGFPTPVMKLSGSLPKGLIFLDNGNGTATLNGTPEASALGTYNFDVLATNSAGTAILKVTLVVVAPAG